MHLGSDDVNIHCIIGGFISKFLASLFIFTDYLMLFMNSGPRIWYSDLLRTGRSMDGIPVETRFSAPVQTAPGAHPVSYTMVTVSFPG
jgi:hypothetical protein